MPNIFQYTNDELAAMSVEELENLSEELPESTTQLNLDNLQSDLEALRNNNR